MSSPYDSSITERAEELAQEMGDTRESTIELLEHWLAVNPTQHLSKSNQSLLMDFEGLGLL